MTAARWWSWNADLPAEMRHLPSGFAMTPLLYAASADRATRLPPGAQVAFGPRPIGDREINLDLAFAGTRLAWRYAIAAPDALGLHWRTEAFGEWGLRFWVLLCFHGGSFQYDTETATLTGAAGGRRLTVRSAKAPLLVTFHEGLEDLESELAEKGYFYLGSRGREGSFAALRFNLEEAPEMRVALSLDEAEAAVPAPVTTGPPSPLQASLEAMHDVIAWNHVYDFVNGRPYTGLSRFWNSKKFGGFGVWLDDILYNAWLWGHFDAARARENLEAVFVWQTEAGNFPCLVTGNDAWRDRSQPPVAAFVVWTLAARSGDWELVERSYPALLRNYRWWWARRGLADTGLLAYGTSLEVGDGLYKGTKLAAKDESSMDNSPVHDPAPFDEKSGLLLAADVGLNSLAALDGEVLALMAAAMGRTDERRELADRVAAHKARIADWLWDEERQVFANRRLDGDFIASLAPTSFYPLAAGIGSAAQVAALVSRYLEAEDKFGGRFVLPSVTRDDPAYHDNVYWRGRIWGPLNFWVYQGLRRAGRTAEAAELAAKSRRLFELGWRRRLCGENYNAETGAIDDQPDSDGFYSWGALLPALAVSEALDVTPWDGWSLQVPASPGRLGPLTTPAGSCYLAADGEAWRLEREGGAVLLAGNLTGRITQMQFDARGVAGALLPAAARDGLWIEVPAGAAYRLGQDRVTGRTAVPRGQEPLPLQRCGA